MKKDRILLTGATGQIGSVLLTELRQRHGHDNVIASDIRSPRTDVMPFEFLDILNKKQLFQIVRKYKITQIYHLVAVLSARGEAEPLRTWDINLTGLFNVLEAAREYSIKLYFPSSIAVFGGETPKKDTPQQTVMTPTTIYGMSKVAGEYWCNYYHIKYGLDVRSLRYPGIIGYQSMPGGGTTDYAVEIYHAAVLGEDYTCFLKKDTRLPMMYMDDAIRATLGIMEADPEKISIHTSYNLAGMSFTPAEIATAIRKHYPDFKVGYEPDFRQKIADSWTQSIDDTQARKDWNWKPQFDLERMTADMIKQLKLHYGDKAI